MKPILYKMGLFISTLCMSTLAFAADPATTETEGTPTTSTETMPAATDTSTAQPATTTALTEQAGFSRGSVVRSIFTSAIQDREPIDKLANSASDTEQIFYFTELRDMSGQTATHRWEFDGKVMAEVQFDIRGPRWRVWSSKSFVPSTAGDWKVSVVNGAGETISEEMISLSQIPDQNSASQMPANESIEGKTEPASTTNNEAPLAPTGTPAE